MKSHGTSPAADGWQTASPTRLSRRLHIARRRPAARVHARRRADRDRLAEAGGPAAGERAGRPDARSSSKRSSRTSSRTSAGTTISSICCRRWSRRCSSTTRRSGGCRGAFAPSARTAATISRSACAAIRSPTPGARRSRRAARSGGRLALAANGGSLVQRVRRLLGAPTHAGRAPGWLAGGLALVLLSGIGAGAVGTERSASAAARFRRHRRWSVQAAAPGFAKEAAVQTRAEELAVDCGRVAAVPATSARRWWRHARADVVSTAPVLAARRSFVATKQPLLPVGHPAPAMFRWLQRPAVCPSRLPRRLSHTARSAGRTTARNSTSATTARPSSPTTTRM